MTTITREITINAPREHVWEILADFGNVYRTNPNIVASHLTSAQTQGVGTTRHCDLSLMGAQLEERIAGWEEGQRLEIDIYDWKNLPGMKKMSAEFTLQSKGSQTVLQATMFYELGWGVMGQLMDSAMMRRQNAKGWTEFVAGIKHYAETGQSVDKKTTLDLAPVIAIA